MPAMTRFEIMHLGHQGDGVADGPVYAPMTVPGDVVTGDLSGDRLENIRVDTPSPLRVKARCAHFKSCGGCSVQHVADQTVSDWKWGIVENSLKAHGIETDIRPIVTSPARSRRRATFAARRTKSGAMAGFHGRRSETVLSIHDCHLVTPALQASLPLCEALAGVGASRKHGLDVTVTETKGGLDVAVTGGKPMDAALGSELARLAEAHDVARIAWDGEVAILCSRPEVSFDGIGVTLPPGAFLQATEHGEQSLREAVHAICGDAKRVFDLFAGCGTFTLPLARYADICAFEGEKTMVKALQDGWRHGAGLKALKAEARDLFRNPLLASELRKCDAVVIDPPRAGAEAQIAELMRSDVPVIAYVSCNSQTFARDALSLVSAGYTLDWVQPVDQFRWSPHVELVGAFKK